MHARNNLLAPPLAASRPRASLRRNIGALYTLQAANYLIPLATLPYLIRTLGPLAYGRMALAYATVFFMVLFVDAGFNTRATRELARTSLTGAQAGEIFLATQIIKLCQALAMLVLLVALVTFVPQLRPQRWLYLCSFMAVIGSLAFPTWLFQGLELMHYTTACSVAGRLAVTIAIFAFVHSADDIVVAVLLQSSGTLLAGLLAFALVIHRLGLSLDFTPRGLGRAIHRALRESWPLALSEYAANATSNLGVLALGLYAGAGTVGVYAAAEKVARAAQSLFSPVLQALLPRAAREWQANPVRAGLRIDSWVWRISLAGCAAAALLAVLAAPGLKLAFGHGWERNAPLLRVFCAWLALSVSAAAIGQLRLVACGRIRPYARAQLIGSVAQLIAMLLLAPALGAVGVASAMVISEALRLATNLRSNRPLPA